MSCRVELGRRSERSLCGELDDRGTFNVVNEQTARDVDDDTNDDFTLTYDAAGHLTDDGENYEYVYDAFGRLRFVKDTGNQSVIAEYTYNGLGYRIGWHYDVDADGTVEANTEQNSDDPWFHFVYDTSWRIVAVYRVLHWHAEGGWTFDDDPKERFVYHNAGLAGGGGSSYIDAVVLRDRDANTAWEDQADGTLEERVYYCQNWRADVVALFSSAGHMLQQVRYDPYGVPFGISKADLTADGVLDSNDSSRFTTLYNSGSGTHPFADWNLDGTLNSQDPIAYLNSYNADVALGYGVLGYGFSRAGGANRKGYAGYEIDPVLTGANGRESVYHVRHRVLLSELGRWNRRDPLGYVYGTNLYNYVGGKPIAMNDPSGLREIDVDCPRIYMRGDGETWCDYGDGDDDDGPPLDQDQTKVPCCKRAAERNRGVTIRGVLACCDGVPTICVFTDRINARYNNPNARRCITHCVAVHECRHLLDQCDGLIKPCGGPSDPDSPYSPPPGNDPNDPLKPDPCMEYRAYRDQADCLMKMLDSNCCGNDKTCKDQVLSELQNHVLPRTKETLRACKDNPEWPPKRGNPGLQRGPDDDYNKWCKCEGSGS